MIKGRRRDEDDRVGGDPPADLFRYLSSSGPLGLSMFVPIISAFRPATVAGLAPAAADLAFSVVGPHDVK